MTITQVAVDILLVLILITQTIRIEILTKQYRNLYVLLLHANEHVAKIIDVMDEERRAKYGPKGNGEESLQDVQKEQAGSARD